MGVGPAEGEGATETLRPLAPDQKRYLRTSEGWTGRGMGANLISESGLYLIALRCQSRPETSEFQDWVTRTVLPAIRRDGAYIQGEEKVASGELSEDEFVLKALTILQGKVERLKAENAVMDQKLNLVTVDAYRALPLEAVMASMPLIATRLKFTRTSYRDRC